MITIKTGVSAASTAALLALAALQAAPALADHHMEAKNVQCHGVNACKGTSDCKTAENACKGQNVCKGHGIKAMSAEDCTKAGGTTEPKKS